MYYNEYCYLDQKYSYVSNKRICFRLYLFSIQKVTAITTGSYQTYYILPQQNKNQHIAVVLILLFLFKASDLDQKSNG